MPVLYSYIGGYLSFYLSARVYMEIVAIGIAAYFAINTLHMRDIKRIPMSEALKYCE